MIAVQLTAPPALERLEKHLRNRRTTFPRFLIRLRAQATERLCTFFPEDVR